MTHEQIRDRLDDLVDRTLEPRELAELETHLASCEECRAEVEGLRSLVAGARDLPVSIEPPQDLWPGVATRIGRRDWASRTVWSARYGLAAAAALLVLVTASLTLVLVRGSGGGPAAELPPHLAEWERAEASYTRAAGELEEALEAAKGSLAPEAVALIEENIRIIDRAIRESRAALDAEPGNRDILLFLSAMYERKLDVLQQIMRSSAAL